PAGLSELPASHPAPDRAGRSRYPRLSWRSVRAGTPRHQGRHHQDTRAVVQFSHGQARDSRNAYVSPGFPLAQSAPEAVCLARFPGDQKGARSAIGQNCAGRDQDHTEAVGTVMQDHPVTANLIANSSAKTITAGEASRGFPEISLASAYVIKPRPIPVAIE